MPFTRPVIALAVATLLSSCTVGPDYHPPVIQISSAFGELGTTSTTQAATTRAGITPDAPVIEWWQTFRDPELSRLIAKTLRSNFDIQMATARILEARGQRGIAAADLFPDVTADGGYAHAHGSKNVTIPLGAFGGGAGGQSSGAGGTAGGAAAPEQSIVPHPLQSPGNSPTGGSAGGAAGGSLGNAPAPPLSPLGDGGLPGATTDLFQTGFDATWELDVFGGTRRSVEAANANVAAAVEDRADVTVSLLAEVARDYLSLRGAQHRLAIAQENLALEKELLAVTRSAQKSGLITQLDVTRAAAQVASTQATLPPLEAQVRIAIHALSILMSEDPNALAQELDTPAALPAAPPTIPIGLPSDLLRRRSDIRRAERHLAATTAQIGAATADLFPKFGLTGSVGLDATRFSHLFDSSSNYFLISPTVSWPVFDAGRIASNIYLQKATQQEALLQYKKSVLGAFRDVEDALANYSSELARHDSLAEVVNQSRQSVDIANQQYHQGLVDFLNVLDAQRTYLNARDELALSDQTVLTNLVALYKALGGGWQIPLENNEANR